MPWRAVTDSTLVLGTMVGATLAVVALCGVRPRICMALSTVLYFGYTIACRTFLSFQWDNLLIECGMLASFLPTDRPAPAAHLLFRLLTFKLYFESGIAKWQSEIEDWHDGSAMAFYYETAPLPTALAWYAHNLPAWWHAFESRTTLVLELVLPFAIFGPRKARLAVAIVFTAFQLIDIATANYGFFCFLAAILHLFLLEDRDLPRKLQEASVEVPRRWTKLWPAGVGVYAVLSLLGGLRAFTDVSVSTPIDHLRVVNTYHLFASITRERIEPELALQLRDGTWQTMEMWHKAGDPARRPGWVAPHQPRLDFQLWFFGLGFRGRPPSYVMALLTRACREPDVIQSLFRQPLPRDPQVVRLSFHQYKFTTSDERARTGAWWTRTLVDATPAIPCDR